MGGGISSSRDFHRERESTKKEYFRDVEKFVASVYLNFSNPQTMKILLTIDMASFSFLEFLKFCKDERYFLLYIGCHDLLNRQLRADELWERFDRLYDKFFLSYVAEDFVYHVKDLSPTMRERCMNVLSFGPHNNEAAITHVLLDLLEELISILAANNLRQFLLSKYYMQWRLKESRHAVATTSRDIDKATIRTSSSLYHQTKLAPAELTRDSPSSKHGEGIVFDSDTSQSSSSVNKMTLSVEDGQYTYSTTGLLGSSPVSTHSRLEQSWHLQNDPVVETAVSSMKSMNIRKFMDLSLNAFVNIGREEVEKVLTGENWLASLLSASEGLPLGLSLATAKAYQHGFPVIFVNKCFQMMTGYQRSDIVGKNLKFLQCKETEASQIKKLSDSLRGRRSCTVILTNKTATDATFRSVVAVKPILNDVNQYCYIVGIHIDVTKDADAGEARKKHAEMLLGLLPGKFFADTSDY